MTIIIAERTTHVPQIDSRFDFCRIVGAVRGSLALLASEYEQNSNIAAIHKNQHYLLYSPQNEQVESTIDLSALFPDSHISGMVVLNDNEMAIVYRDGTFSLNNLDSTISVSLPLAPKRMIGDDGIASTTIINGSIFYLMLDSTEAFLVSCQLNGEIIFHKRLQDLSNYPPFRGWHYSINGYCKNHVSIFYSGFEYSDPKYPECHGAIILDENGNLFKEQRIYSNLNHGDGDSEITSGECLCIKNKFAILRNKLTSLGTITEIQEIGSSNPETIYDSSSINAITNYIGTAKLGDCYYVGREEHGIEGLFLDWQQ